MANWKGSVADIVALKALSTTNIPDCTPIYVEAQNAWYGFNDSVACAVNNDITCADANDVGGSWNKLVTGVQTFSIYIPAPANQSYTIHPDVFSSFVVLQVEGWLESGTLDLDVIYEDGPDTLSTDVGVGPNLLSLTQSFTAGNVYPAASRLRADVANVAAAVGLTITVDYISPE